MILPASAMTATSGSKIHKHPLSESFVSSLLRDARSPVAVIPATTGAKIGIKRLVDFSQTVRDADNGAIDTDSRQRHAGCATDKISEHDDIQTGNKGVNQLVGTDRRGITKQMLRSPSART